MATKYNIGDTAFIVVSNHVIREVKIINVSGGFYTIKFTKGSGGIRVRENRLFSTTEEAEKSFIKTKPASSSTPIKTKRPPTPWD